VNKKTVLFIALFTFYELGAEFVKSKRGPNYFTIHFEFINCNGSE